VIFSSYVSLPEGINLSKIPIILPGILPRQATGVPKVGGGGG
jgi:hypothetical protein